jgi:hypothetical protein
MSIRFRAAPISQDWRGSRIDKIISVYGTDRLKSTRPIDLHWQTHASDLTRVSECLYFREKIPLRENARRTGLSRNTLRTGLRQLDR